jgi:MFS family permease
LSQIKEWIELLHDQKKIFKINIQRNLLQNFSNSLTQQFQSIYITALGANPLLLGSMYSVSGAINTILSIPIGVIADKIGIKRTLLMTSLVSIIGALLFSVSNNWTLAAIALVLSTVGFNLNYTVCPMICGSAVKSSERVTVMGICDTITFTPFLVGPIIAASLITYFGGMNISGIRPLFIIQFIGLVFSLLLISVRFSNPDISMDNSELRIFETIRGIVSETNSILSWILLYFLSNFPYFVVFYTPLYAAEVKGANQFIIGGMSAASMIVSIVLAVPIGHLADKIGRRKIFIASTLLSSLSYFFLIHSQGELLLIISGLLSGFVMPMLVILSAISFDLVPKDYLGSWIGFLGFIGGLSNIIAPILCGYIWDNISPQSVFYFLILIRFASLITLIRIPRSIMR